MHVIWHLIINNLNIRGERSWFILMLCWFCLHSALMCSAVCKVSEGFWHELVPSEVECGWLHLWHRHGHCTNWMWLRVWMIALLSSTGSMSACNGTKWSWVWVDAFVASIWLLYSRIRFTSLCMHGYNP